MLRTEQRWMKHAVTVGGLQIISIIIITSAVFNSEEMSKIHSVIYLYFYLYLTFMLKVRWWTGPGQ